MASIFATRPADRNRLEHEFMDNIANTKIPDRPEPARANKRINPELDATERKQIADNLAHKGAERSTSKTIGGSHSRNSTSEGRAGINQRIWRAAFLKKRQKLKRRMKIHASSAVEAFNKTLRLGITVGVE